jgi:hypothetical protein
VLTAEQHDRSAAVLLGLASGDALAAGDGFEWTERTAPAVDLARITAEGGDPRDAAVLDELRSRWGRKPHAPLPVPFSAGGCLLGTAPVALALLGDPLALAEAARNVCALTGSYLTRADPEAGDACALFGLSLRAAVLEGRLDPRAGLGTLPAAARAAWEAHFAAAARGRIVDGPRLGPVGGVLQGAWAILGDTPPADASRVEQVINAAARSGADPASVAAVGALLAGRWGLEAIPADWRRRLHGRPDLFGIDLVRLGMLSARNVVPHDPDDSARMDVLR